MDPYSTELLWMVIVGFILAFFLAFAIGANDVRFLIFFYVQFIQSIKNVKEKITFLSPPFDI